MEWNFNSIVEWFLKLIIKGINYWEPITYTHKIPGLAHGNGHTAIGSRIGQDQFRLLSW